MSSDSGLESRSASGRFGAYEVLRELGSGASSSVYLARREGEQRTLALKVMGVTLSPTALERFRREAKLLSRLKHPGLARCLDSGLDPVRNSPFLVLEYVHGTPLHQFAAQPLDPADAAKLIADLADAVGYAHGQGILHRDIKPENVVVREADGRPVLIDFGLARSLFELSDLTADGDLLGTPSYMAPEQVRSEPTDALTDVYALGAVLYRLLTGRPPFEGADLLELCGRIKRGGPVPPRRLNPAVPGALERVCLQALAVSPSQRFASAHALGRALRGPQIFVPGSPPRPRWILPLALTGLLALALPLGWVAARALPSPDGGPLPAETPPQTGAAEDLPAEGAANKEHALLRRLDERPDELDPYVELARYRLQRGDLAGASRIVEQAGALAVDLRPLEAVRGELKAQRGAERDLILRSERLLDGFRPDAALELVETSLAERPGSSALRAVAARACLTYGGFSAAREHLEQAYLLDPALTEDPVLRDLYEATVGGVAVELASPRDNPLWQSWTPFLGGVWESQPGDWITGRGEGLGPYELGGLLWPETPDSSHFSLSTEIGLGSDGESYGGLLFSALEPGDFYLVYVFVDRKQFLIENGAEGLRRYLSEFGHDPSCLRVARVAHGEWLHVDTQLVPFTDAAPVRLKLEVDGDTVTAWVNEQRVDSWQLERELTGRVGLMKFYDCRVRFRGFRLD